jgi:hypothetical protein
MDRHYQITFYVPVEHCEKVKQTMFEAGAGHLENYQECSWQTLGQGQFRPSEGSMPYIGKIDKLEKLDEYKVEMLCIKENIKPVIQALISSHPYEVPAYSVIALKTL